MYAVRPDSAVVLVYACIVDMLKRLLAWLKFRNNSS